MIRLIKEIIILSLLLTFSAVAGCIRNQTPASIEVTHELGQVCAESSEECD